MEFKLNKYNRIIHFNHEPAYSFNFATGAAKLIYSTKNKIIMHFLKTSMHVCIDLFVNQIKR